MKWIRLRIAAMVAAAAIAGYAGSAPAMDMGMKSSSNTYLQTNLVSNTPGLAPITGNTLFNPWGIAFFPGMSPFWVNDNNGGISALYNGMGVANPGLPSVIIPSPTSPTGGASTGIVANLFAQSGDFLIPGPNNSNFGPALFTLTAKTAPFWLGTSHQSLHREYLIRGAP